MTDLQKLILTADLQQTHGLSPVSAMRLVDELLQHPEKEQLAFYYRSFGLTQQEISDIIDVSQKQVSCYLSGMFKKVLESLIF